MKAGKRGDGRDEGSASGAVHSGPPARPRAVTVHDIARDAGVSSMTVSRVVNGNIGVSEDLRERVNASIRKLDYVPNLAARAARSGARRVGILFSNPGSSNLGEFLMGAFRESGNNGCQLLIEPTLAHATEIDALKKLIGAGIDGVILPPPLCDSIAALELVSRAGIPALSFATAEPRLHASAVLIDDFEASRAMTRYLIELGHSRIAFVSGDPRHSPAVRREEGFRVAMAEAGLAVRPDWMAQGHFTYRSGLEVGRALLGGSDRPSAIVSGNDDMAAAIMAVAHGLDLKIPGDVSITGFDDTPIAMTIWPELTTIRQPIAEMAATAVAMVVEAIKHRRRGDEPAAQHHVAKFTLMERASTSAPG